MELKAVGLLRKFESIKDQVKDILSSLKNFEIKRIQARGTPLPYEIIGEIEDIEHDKITETKMILDEYWNSSSEVSKILSISLSYFSPPTTIEEAKGVLRLILIECDKVIGALNALIVPLSPQDADKLSKLRSEIVKTTAKLDVNFRTNLDEAIKECEAGHFLASALITSRVIRYILEQIEGQKIEEKIEFLRKKKILAPTEDVKEFILKADVKVRNLLVHRIDTSANPSDALGLLGDCVRLLEIFDRIKAGV